MLITTLSACKTLLKSENRSKCISLTETKSFLKVVLTDDRGNGRWSKDNNRTTWSATTDNKPIFLHFL